MGFFFNKNMNNIKIIQAEKKHLSYVTEISQMIYLETLNKGIGLARRSQEYLSDKIKTAKSVIALDGEIVVGFCYIESWGHKKFVANSGLIIHKRYRKNGLAKAIKRKAFEISRNRFPSAKIFGLTTNLAVMMINSDLQYRPVTFSMLTNDSEFWEACRTCPNYDIFQRTGGKNCLCTAMVFDPKRKNQNNRISEDMIVSINVNDKLINYEK